MTEGELMVFDILRRPALSADERAEVTKVARDLLARLKAFLVLNWQQKATVRPQLKLVIVDVLDAGLPRARTPDLYLQKYSTVFEHEYVSYAERNAGMHAKVP